MKESISEDFVTQYENDRYTILTTLEEILYRLDQLEEKMTATANIYSVDEKDEIVIKTIAEKGYVDFVELTKLLSLSHPASVPGFVEGFLKRHEGKYQTAKRFWEKYPPKNILMALPYIRKKEWENPFQNVLDEISAQVESGRHPTIESLNEAGFIGDDETLYHILDAYFVLGSTFPSKKN